MIDVNYRTAKLVQLYKEHGFEHAVDYMEMCLLEAHDGEEIVR